MPDPALTVYLPRRAPACDEAWPRVTVVIVNWNCRAHLRECLESLRATRYPACDVLIVDQGSADGAREMALEEFPETTVLALDRNVEFFRGNHLGVYWALDHGAEYVFMLNNDTTVDPECIGRLVATLRAHPEVGLLSAHAQRYHDARIEDLGVAITWWCGHLDNIRPHQVPPGTTLLLCDYVWGAALMGSRAVLAQLRDSGEDWNLYHEDADLCLRARRRGYLSGTCMDALIRHKLGMSTTTYQRHFLHGYYRLRNLVRLVGRHAPPVARALFAALFVPYVVPRHALVVALSLWRTWRAAPGARFNYAVRE